MSMAYRIVNGTVADGTGAPLEKRDVCIGGGQIVPSVSESAEVIDASGLIVAPGFVDVHRHADFAALTDPRFGEAELNQGITSIIVGNCGLAPVPNAPGTRHQQFDYIAPCLGTAPDFAIDSYAEYADALKKANLPLNVGFLCATGAVMACVNGYGEAPLSRDQEKRALSLIDEAFDAGAVGLSSGLMYRPECYAPRDLLVKMADRAARRDAVWTCHIRVEGDGLVEAVDEVISIAREANARLNISHFKSTGVKNWRSTLFRAIDKIEAVRAKGMDVTVDFYPYTCGATTLSSLLPPGIEPGAGKYEQVLRAAQSRPAGWDNMAESIGWERIIVSSVYHDESKRLEGMSIADIAKEWEMDGWAAVLRLLEKEENKVGIILNSMCESDVDAVAYLPYSALISDALYGPGDRPHPRRYGAFPRFFRQYVTEKRLLSAEAAIHKMTDLPATRFGLAKRGRIAEGYRADLVLFDPARLIDRADYEQPTRPAEGIISLLINGKLTEQNGRRTGAHGEFIYGV